MRSKVLTATGLALPPLALAVLLLTGRTSLATSADEQADPVPLAAVVVPLLAGILLVRLIPWVAPPPVLAEPAIALRRQVAALIGIALAFPVIALVLDDVLYGPVKVVLLLGGGWLALRIWRAPRPERPPVRWYWPIPALLAWAYLSHFSPLRPEQDLSGYREMDPYFLGGVVVFTFLTASVTEELFYRVMLQTRLEALWGRWPAIAASSLLFAAMHVHRFGDGPAWEVTALILVSNGGFGVFAGYLWSRHRSVWALIVLHGAVNSLGLLPLVL